MKDLLKVAARVGIGSAKEGGSGLTVALDLELDAALIVGGESIERRAA